MFPASADAISANDIVSLVANQTPERKTLEFKEKLPEGTDKAKKEFLADVCSFANAEGGPIVYGIREKRAADGQPTGIAEAVVSLTDPNPSIACDRLEQLVRTGIAPRIPVVQVRKIELANQEWVIVLRIGRSWVRPHMVVFAGTSRFYSRNSSGKFQLDVGEIGQAFAEQRTVGERLRNWRTERISRLLSGDGPMPLDGKRTFDRDVITTPDFQILDRNEGRPYIGSILPLINSIWQANGYEQSPFAVPAWNPFER